MPVGAGRTAKRRDEEFSVLGIYSVFYHDCIMSPLRAPKFPLIMTLTTSSILLLLVLWQLGRTPLCAIVLRSLVAGALVAGTMDKIAEICFGQALYTQNPKMKECLLVGYVTSAVMFFVYC